MINAYMYGTTNIFKNIILETNLLSASSNIPSRSRTEVSRKSDPRLSKMYFLA